MAEERQLRQGQGPYVVESLIDDISLPEGSHITCCEYWDSNLYIGTSTSEVLHFVAILDASASRPQFILASRQEPSSASSDALRGVQQIVLLPRVGKACILCNGVLTFHSLPELSPAGSRKVSGCTWIGGKDLDLGADGSLEDSVTLLLCTRKRIRLVRVGDETQVLRNIEYPDCLAVARRGRFACVGDHHSYSLLDVDNQQKIPLFPISSTDEAVSTSAVKQSVSLAHANEPSDRALSPGRRGPLTPGERGHGRATSLGQFVGNLRLRGNPESSPNRASPDLLDTSSDVARRPSFEAQAPDSGTSTPNRPGTGVTPTQSPAQGATERPTAGLPRLRPYAVSPSPSEFLVTVGTDLRGPAMGMFVNVEGDVSRENLNFESYPYSVALDGATSQVQEAIAATSGDHRYVLAAMCKQSSEHIELGVETHDLDESTTKSWLRYSRIEIPVEGRQEYFIGVAAVETAMQVCLPTVGGKLQAQRFWPRGDPNVADEGQGEAEKVRMQQEEEFAQRLGTFQSRMIIWSGARVSMLVRSPLIDRLDMILGEAVQSATDPKDMHQSLLDLIQRMRGMEPRSEAEYLSLEYIRQKISVLLFMELSTHRLDADSRFQDRLLLEGNADPRISLSKIPLLRDDIFVAKDGMWIHAGLVSLMRERYSSLSIALDADEILSRPEEYDVLGLLKRFLVAWRQRKGFGSITDETYVFATVDAALLHVLLHQDQQSKLGPGRSSAIRAELYALVDSGVDCFDHAVLLLEGYHRLYVLSRLYQSRRMSAMVLATWRRILDGEEDAGGEFTDGENEVRKYLARRGDAGLVEDYGSWLARRDPSLGVQAFTDDHSKIKLPPHQVVAILRKNAPDAVKVYLEHLVFGKKDTSHANDLITYYLDSVLGALNGSPSIRATLGETYEAYRALQAPKPTYRQFITDNAMDASWWGDRLRLLELLGGTFGAAFSYDVSGVLDRIAPFEDALVPESIILQGRQSHHQQALRLLTHGMGDYHTAINYCLLGGSSMFHPASGSVRPEGITGRNEPGRLFQHLLQEFLAIEDDEARLEQTGELLTRFGTWFEIDHVLNSVPASWPVETILPFLSLALRRLRQERNETMITKALHGLESIKNSSELVEKCRELGPTIVPATDTPTSMT